MNTTKPDHNELEALRTYFESSLNVLANSFFTSNSIEYVYVSVCCGYLNVNVLDNKLVCKHCKNDVVKKVKMRRTHAPHEVIDLLSTEY